jgi:NTE family protein
MTVGAQKEQNVLVLQGGGALGAYQAGAYEALMRSAHHPDWIAGISIGAINAAIIAGNPPERRLEKLRSFWAGVTSRPDANGWFSAHWARQMLNEAAAAAALACGAPGFFTPRFPPAPFMPHGTPEALSYYDTSPLAATLHTLVDFDFLNEKGPRLSVGAVDVETGNFAYFDSKDMVIGPEHIMASGALPPGFAPIAIEGRIYWDGGLVSNTPLQFVLESAGERPLCVFQIDLFSANGEIPINLDEVGQREKDIRFSSRTRLTTDRFRQLAEIGAAIARLGDKLPPELRDDPDLKFLRTVGPDCPVTLVHLIHRKEGFESQSKDYEFSRLSMIEHWAAGDQDVERSLAHPAWKRRKPVHHGIQIFDFGAHNAKNPDGRSV